MIVKVFLMEDVYNTTRNKELRNKLRISRQRFFNQIICYFVLISRHPFDFCFGDLSFHDLISLIQLCNEKFITSPLISLLTKILSPSNTTLRYLRINVFWITSIMLVTHFPMLKSILNSCFVMLLCSIPPHLEESKQL